MNTVHRGRISQLGIVVVLAAFALAFLVTACGGDGTSALPTEELTSKEAPSGPLGLRAKRAIPALRVSLALWAHKGSRGNQGHRGLLVPRAPRAKKVILAFKGPLVRRLRTGSSRVSRGLEDLPGRREFKAQRGRRGSPVFRDLSVPRGRQALKGRSGLQGFEG